MISRLDNSALVPLAAPVRKDRSRRAAILYLFQIGPSGQLFDLSIVPQTRESEISAPGVIVAGAPGETVRRPLVFFALALAALQTNCGSSSGGTGGTGGGNPQSGITVMVSPSSANVRAGATKSFSATISGTSNTGVTWQVNGVAGGSSALGTISASGSYTAPASLPNPNSVEIKAVSTEEASATGTSEVTLWNPAPVLASVSPATFPTGSFTLTVNGSSFISGAQVIFGGVNLTTTFVSSTKLTATGTATATGTVMVQVQNPNPGASDSGFASVQVTSSGGGGNGGGQAGTCGGMSPGQGGSLNGFVPFPSNNAWNTDISSAPVDPNSAAIINFIGTSDPLHPDFGAGLYNGSSIGIPYSVVDSSQAPVTITLTDYADESDPGPMPVPANAQIEGYPAPGNGDRHVLVLDNSNCWLYELYNAATGSGGSWSAASTAVWDLQNNEQRPLTWTSADAAGLSIFAGLVRYDEVAAGAINHAIRFTLVDSRAAFIPPASHWAATSTNANAAPMGMRMRLKASFDISGFSPANQVILTALKKYGMIMADNGSNLYISGAPDDRWDNDDLHNLTTLTTADFEVVQMNPVYTQSNLPQGAAPAISSFTASPQIISSGQSATLNWTATGASYYIVSPQIGAIRGTSVSVAPTQTTTYTLYATGEFGRATSTVTVTVQ